MAIKGRCLSGHMKKSQNIFFHSRQPDGCFSDEEVTATQNIVNTNLQSKNSMVNIYLSIYLSYVAGVRFPSNLVHVISACWRYLCSSPLSSSSRSPFIISLPLSPSALRSNKKRTESVGVDRCFTHAAAQLTGRRDEEKEGEEDRGRQKERR